MPPVQGRAYRRVIELELRRLDCRLIGLDEGGELIDQRLRRVLLLLGVEAARGEIIGAAEIELGIGELGFVLRPLRGRLIDSGLERARVDLGEHVALLHELAFVEIDLLKLSVDAGADGYRVVGLDGADAGQIDGQVLSGHLRNRDRNWRTRMMLGGSLLRGLGGMPPPDTDTREEDDQSPGDKRSLASALIRHHCRPESRHYPLLRAEFGFNCSRITA